MKRFLMFLLVLALLCGTATVLNAGAAQAPEITINKTDVTLTKGDTLQLKLRGTKQAVTWKTTDQTVAAVNENGVVTAKQAGKAVVYTKLDGVKYRCVIRVEAPKLSRKTLTLVVGQTAALKMNGTSRRVKWASSDAAVVKVAKDGTVAAKAKGKAVITATVGKKNYTCKIRVEAPKLSETTLVLTEGETAALQLRGTTKTVVWRSTNEAVATVKDGAVTAVDMGTAKIVAKVGGQKFICTVTVRPAGVRSELVDAKYYDTGDGVVAVLTNHNDRAVAATVTVEYFDESGALIDTDQNTVDPLGTGRTAAIRVFGAYDEYHWTPLNYASCKATLTVEPSAVTNDALLDGSITTAAEAGADALQVTVRNSGDKDCGFLQLAVLYFDKDGALVGYADGFAYGANAGATDTVTFAYPNEVPPTEANPLTYQVFVNYAY